MGLKFIYNDILFFNAVFTGIEKGYRHYFRKIPAVFEACRGVCETLDLLRINILKRNSVKEIIKDLKAD